MVFDLEIHIKNIQSAELDRILSTIRSNIVNDGDVPDVLVETYRIDQHTQGWGFPLNAIIEVVQTYKLLSHDPHDFDQFCILINELQDFYKTQVMERIVGFIKEDSTLQKRFSKDISIWLWV